MYNSFNVHSCKIITDKYKQSDNNYQNEKGKDILSYQSTENISSTICYIIFQPEQTTQSLEDPSKS